MPYRRLHNLRTLEHERKLHLARAKQLANRLHPIKKNVVDDRQRLIGLQGVFKVRLKVLLDSLDNVLFEDVFDPKSLKGIGLSVNRPHILESSHELNQRVIRN